MNNVILCLQAIKSTSRQFILINGFQLKDLTFIFIHEKYKKQLV